MLTAERIVELFERDARARRRLAELLVSEPDVRLAVINAVLRDVATKHDLAELKRDLESKIDREVDALRREIDALREEIGRLYRLVIVSVLGILVSIATTVIVRALLP